MTAVENHVLAPSLQTLFDVNRVMTRYEEEARAEREQRLVDLLRTSHDEGARVDIEGHTQLSMTYRWRRSQSPRLLGEDIGPRVLVLSNVAVADASTELLVVSETSRNTNPLSQIVNVRYHLFPMKDIVRLEWNDGHSE